MFKKISKFLFSRYFTKLYRLGLITNITSIKLYYYLNLLWQIFTIIYFQNIYYDKINLQYINVVLLKSHVIALIYSSKIKINIFVMYMNLFYLDS